MGETELLAPVVAQWPILGLLATVGGLVYRVMAAQHERHAAAMAQHIARMDARDARMLDLVAEVKVALQGISGTLTQLASIDRLEGVLREDARERRGGHAQ